MDWDAFPGAWKIPAIWSFLDSHRLWEVVWPLVVWCQLMAFCSLLLVATVDARLKLRKKYVELLDRMFHFAAAKLPDEGDDEEESEEDNGVVICPEAPRAEPASPPGSFSLQDTIPYLMAGMKVVVHDSIRKSFLSAELRTWNMLSRTKRRRYLRTSPSLTVFYALGFLVRWVVLMPVRLLLLVLSLTTLVLLCAGVGLLPTSDFKRRLNARVVMWGFDFVAGAISVVARFHNTENRPSHGIAVANHTSPIDSMVLATDQCYDMVGQKSRGILGVFMTALARSSHHIWFDRAEVKERSQVTKM
ncbi:glycerol-3-phosphate acyltransferase 3-like [Panulirus ornatus]|uniref:glycerol-3-phosphate acyltransferase 3-like n=1 Tax=Panulirus ornatus TaxID=150431 RepID=UPI003A884C0E